VRSFWRRSAAVAAVSVCAFAVDANNPKITITRSGSTNTVGVELTLDGGEKATIRAQSQAARALKLKSSTIAAFTRAVEAAGPLHSLPANHCIKSVSFGTSLLVSRKDDRSPDLRCADQADPQAAAIRKQAEEILQAAQKASGVQTMRHVY
jgi:hypothetical protein